MKLFISLVFGVAVAIAAEAPVRFLPLRLQRVEQASYAPAGYRPAGQEFRLPERQTNYLPPGVYGVAQQTTTEADNERITTETPTTTEAVTDKLDGIKEEKAELKENEEFEEQGVYYIYHPNGLLQRVVYSTKNDVQNMGYTARLTYRDVQPIKDPIYTYDPETLTLRQIQF